MKIKFLKEGYYSPRVGEQFFAKKDEIKEVYDDYANSLIKRKYAECACEKPQHEPEVKQVKEYENKAIQPKENKSSKKKRGNK